MEEKFKLTLKDIKSENNQSSEENIKNIEEHKEKTSNKEEELNESKFNLFEEMQNDYDEKNEYKYEIRVGPDKEYKKIQEAIDNAKSSTSIKIDHGFYRETLIIKSLSDIELCSSDPKDPAIILSENSPSVFIYCLEDTHTVKIYNLKFIHRGVRDDIVARGDMMTNDFFAWHDEDKNNPESYFIFKNNDEVQQLEVNNHMDNKIIEYIFEENRGNFCCISALKGTVYITNCLISLGFLTTETKNILPAIYIENSTGVIQNCLICNACIRWDICCSKCYLVSNRNNEFD